GSESVNLEVDTTPPDVNCNECDSPDPVKSGTDVVFDPSPDDHGGSGVDSFTVCRTSSCTDPYCSSDISTSCSYTTTDNQYEVKEYYIRVTDNVDNSNLTGPFTFTVKKWAGESCDSDVQCLLGDCTEDLETGQMTCEKTIIPEPGIILR
ncbi:MAG: hypothetical protein ABEI07_00610, partial [Candidatus Nanohaloarchaea archaeon]